MSNIHIPKYVVVSNDNKFFVMLNGVMGVYTCYDIDKAEKFDLLKDKPDIILGPVLYKEIITYEKYKLLYYIEENIKINNSNNKLKELFFGFDTTDVRTYTIKNLEMIDDLLSITNNNIELKKQLYDYLMKSIVSNHETLLYFYIRNCEEQKENILQLLRFIDQSLLYISAEYYCLKENNI